jgi:hypothetical protein
MTELPEPKVRGGKLIASRDGGEEYYVDSSEFEAEVEDQRRERNTK